MEKQPGMVSFVGAGPGDPELLTLTGKRLIEEAALLLYALLPASSGYEQGMLNIGSIRNRGFEFTLETVNIKTRNFQWSTSFNIAFNRNRILGLVDNQSSLQTSVSWETKFNSQFPYISQVGKPTGMMYGFIYEGTYKPEDFNADGRVLREVASNFPLELFA